MVSETKLAKELDDGQYAYSWNEELVSTDGKTPEEDPAGVTSHLYERAG